MLTDLDAVRFSGNTLDVVIVQVISWLYACCSADKKELALPAGVTAGLVAMMAHPLYAEASVTPSLKNLLNSVVAGALVLGLILGAVTVVSNFDPVSRKW